MTGLIASGSKSALGISRSVVGSHYKSLERLLGEYSFSCDGLNAERLALLDAHNETRSSARGVLIVDDTSVEKEMPEAYKYYDHVDHCYKTGFVLVTLGYADHKTSYPVDVEHYVPQEVDAVNFRTKIEMAKELIKRNQERVRFRFVVYDSWYLCEEMHIFVRSLRKHWISRLKSDRLVLHKGRYLPLAEYAALVKDKAKEVAGKQVYAHSVKLKSIGDRVKLVVIYEDKETYFLASSLVSMKAEGVIRHYSLRFLIDVFHRDAKQHLGLAEWKVRNTEGAKRHWHLLMLAYTLLRLDAASNCLMRNITTMGKSIARQVRLYGFLALMELVWQATKNNTTTILAELLRNGGTGMT